MSSEISELISRNLSEITNIDIIEKIIKVRPLKVYWGTAPTGELHMGYLVPLLKIADFLEAGCKIKILIADLHAYLDTMKSTLKQAAARTLYYEAMIKALLSQLGVNTNQIEFVKGRDYQLTESYTMDMYKMCSHVTFHNTHRAGTDVVKQSENPTISNLLYPILQALDEVYLDVDAQLGGVDQRKIFMFANDYLPRIGYRSKIHMMNPLVPGLSSKETNNEKMSSSDSNSKINILDSNKQIREKINRVYCKEGVIENNTLFSLLEHVIFPLFQRKGQNFVITRPEKHGGNSDIYKNIEILKDDYKNMLIHPLDLKSAIIKVLCEFVDPIREYFSNPQMKKIIKDAYNR